MAARNPLTDTEVDRLFMGTRLAHHATNEVTGDDVDALFSGTLKGRAPAKRLTVTQRPYVARYDRCSACRVIQPALTTFGGDTDWSPELPLDDPLRAAITRLRKATGKRTILLCSPDCDGLDKYRSPTPVIVKHAQLFEC